MIQTDIDRLHKVINGEISGRGCGKTFARIHQMIGYVEVGHKNIYCMITHHSDVNYILELVGQIMYEHKLEYKYYKSTRSIIVNNTNIKFILHSDKYQKTRGCDGVEIPMGHRD